MNRPLYAWIAFGLSFLAVLSAMAWISLAVLRLDRLEGQARAQAEIEEGVRLALWRMDSALTALIAREAGRSYASYMPVRGGKAKVASPDGKGAAGWPGLPDFPEGLPAVLLHFHLGSDGSLSSPEVPEEEGGADGEGARRLAAFRTLTGTAALRELVQQEEAQQVQSTRQADAGAPGIQEPSQQPMAQTDILPRPKVQPGPQQRSAVLNRNEQQARVLQVLGANTLLNDVFDLFPPEPGVRVGLLKAAWIGDSLVLARRVSVSKADEIQGAWVDWPRLKPWLLGLVKDLLPRADLVPARGAPGDQDSRRLAAIPAVLAANAGPTAPAEALSPLQISLLVAWICVLLGAGGAGALLGGVLALSERRAAFVSAVTHELRTPLTTFRMYTEMLAGGMVVGEDQRREYLGTLAREAARLGHLVQNVLAYARLEKGRHGRGHGGAVENLSVGDLLQAVLGTLRERAGQAGMEIAVEAPEGAAAQRVRADRAAVEQILFNLVDNACKYASKAQDRRICIAARAEGRFVEVRVRDHGPGVAEPRGLFRPFAKSAREAAVTAPGVGLGLALSRRLARALKGDLLLDPAVGDGAGFVLRLPRAS